MSKAEVIKNVFTGPVISDKYHLSYIQKLQLSNDNNNVIESLRTGDIETIELTMKNLADAARSSILLLGMACLIIDREAIYDQKGYKSYLDYATHLYDSIGLSPQTLSDAKIIAENYVDHFTELNRAGFKIDQNAHKLRYLEAAIENHPTRKGEVFKRITSSSFRDFKEWAKPREPTEEYQPEIRITQNKIFVDGKNVLSIPNDLSERERKRLSAYLQAGYRIWATGNEPFVLDTYDQGEQRAILIFQKKYRSKK